MRQSFQWSWTYSINKLWWRGSYCYALCNFCKSNCALSWKSQSSNIGNHLQCIIELPCIIELLWNWSKRDNTTFIFSGIYTTGDNTVTGHVTMWMATSQDRMARYLITPGFIMCCMRRKGKHLRCAAKVTVPPESAVQGSRLERKNPSISAITQAELV